MPTRFQLDEDGDSPHEAAAFIKAPESAYQAIYSPWRLYLRELVTKEVEREVPQLAAIQRRFRSPALDRLFVFSGMLGNHSFFLLALPFLHIFGLGVFARGLSFIVLWSIYFSGIVKDYISAPRPASPPVVQITRSPAHTLEYGFPSSHTTYAVATIGYLSYYMLYAWSVSPVWVGLLWTCGATIVVGRVYCGLHSFIDVAGGVVIGVVEALVFICYYERLDALFPTTAGPLYVSALLYFALKSFPPSLDPCPCCIDAFCATSVTVGLAFGYWIYDRLPFLWHNGRSDYVAWDASLTSTQNALRCIIALVLVIIWKIASKPMLLPLVKRMFPGCVSTPSVQSGDSLSAGDSDADCKQGCYAAPSPASIKSGRYGSYNLMTTHENLVRIPIYCGIALTVTVSSPIVFYLLGLMPSS
ncbi:Long-chain base-1-phosphate phosphatase [Coemansia sp. RSA 2711]|nr:Long-chain base-1-phosphate phosphatase [Coemansia sp. RSA 2711]KAJ1847182.1 Long-chain base-1-phosphate phosphatase [Coemansia sp. RSA 2708]KAJ2320694.1 Long-chain base-1-phosphate phosphatase [Coemansia sp. RSA 2704]KAJ2368159.1 Long-chain base-1-phosphate phosphatase [Coemansia sp. RSA 2610]